MGHSQEEKTQSRERIVAAAARQIRADGLDGFSISDVMKEAGLTHGGFYGHFKSRTDLITAALESALHESAVAWSAPSKHRTLPRVVKSYLSRAHRDQPVSGCAVSALGGEVARADPMTRESMSTHLTKYISGISDMLDGEKSDDRAIQITCSMLGALLVSRLITEKDLSNRILEVVQDFVLAEAEPNHAATRA